MQGGGSPGSGAGETNTGSNVGGGKAVFKQKNGAVFEYKTITDTATVTVNETTDTISFDASQAGEANTASNVGTAGVGVFKTKTVDDLELKKINAGSNKLSVTDDVVNDEVVLDVVEANLSTVEFAANKNSASGYVGLDGSSKITGSQQTYGTGANTACEGNDARLSDTRTPSASSITKTMVNASAGIEHTKLDLTAMSLADVGDASTLVTTKGRLVAGDGTSAFTQTPALANDQALIADSAQSSGFAAIDTIKAQITSLQDDQILVASGGVFVNQASSAAGSFAVIPIYFTYTNASARWHALVGETNASNFGALSSAQVKTYQGFTIKNVSIHCTNYPGGASSNVEIDAGGVIKSTTIVTGTGDFEDTAVDTVVAADTFYACKSLAGSGASNYRCFGHLEVQY